jgi:hypothetical protein
MTLRLKGKYLKDDMPGLDLHQDSSTPRGFAKDGTQQEDDRRSRKRAIITMKLNHGDMVVMHGERVQQYYEVRLAPLSPARHAYSSAAN